MRLINFHRGHVLKLTCVICLALLALLGVQTVATAGEESNNESSPSIDWGLSDPWSSVSALSSASTQADTDKQLSKDGSRVAMFRFYNKWTGEHFYTSSIREKNNIEKAGWNYETVGWYAPTDTNLKPVYRLYNPYVEGGDHHYTYNTEERTTCIKAGWKDEGIAWYTVEASTAAENEEADVYRQYNPNAVTGTHNYTMSKEENDNLVKAGWKAEGTAWRGYSKLEASSSALDFSKISVSTTAKTYNGKAQTQTIKSSAYKLNTDYTVTYSNNKNAGTATIVVKGKGNYTGSKTYKFTINKLNISNATVTLGTALTYNTKEQVQTIKSVKVGNLTLSTSDYTVSNNKGTDANSYTLKVTGKGNCTGTATKAFAIAKAKPVCVAPTGLTGTQGDTLLTVDLNSSSVSGNTPGKFVWTEALKEMGETGNKEYSATFMPTDSDNYSTAANINIPVQVVEPSYAGGFWLGIKNAGIEYVNEAYFAKQDSNYVSGTEISAEMKVLHDSTNVNYTTVKAKWDKYYSDDTVRLYATYSGGESEKSFTGATSAKNKFVEFRILEVSGAEGHKLSDGKTSDGSAVTFMATHVLPTAYRMNKTDTNNGGWGACQLYKDMNEVSGTKGEIYKKFSDDFVAQVKAVTKECNIGNKVAQSATPSKVDCQFWIPSFTELVKDSSRTDIYLPKNEGTQYAWCATNVTNTYSSNSCLSYTTRGGATPGSCSSGYCLWWERSPTVFFTEAFGLVSVAGDASNGNASANGYSGIVPAFSF